MGSLRLTSPSLWSSRVRTGDRVKNKSCLYGAAQSPNCGVLTPSQLGDIPICWKGAYPTSMEAESYCTWGLSGLPPMRPPALFFKMFLVGLQMRLSG